MSAKTTIRILPAFNGDSIVVTYTDKDSIPRNIWIDGGTPAAYQKFIKKAFMDLNSNIDLMVVTHIDDDHIGGIKKIFEDKNLDKSKIKKVWFNSGGLLNHYFGEDEDKKRAVKIVPGNIVDMSVNQGNSLESQLDNLQDVWVKKILKAGDVVDVHGCKVTVLSPDESGLSRLNQTWETETDIRVEMSASQHDDFKTDISELIQRPFTEDTGIPNGSSIALLIETGGVKGLLLGDAYPSVVAASLRKMGYSKRKKLKPDFVKVSHHGSKRNTSPELLELIRCQKFIISTNGLKHGLPDKESFARIIHSNKGCSLLFNYGDLCTKWISQNDRSYDFTTVDLSKLDYKIQF